MKRFKAQSREAKSTASKPRTEVDAISKASQVNCETQRKKFLELRAGPLQPRSNSSRYGKQSQRRLRIEVPENDEFLEGLTPPNRSSKSEQIQAGPHTGAKFENWWHGWPSPRLPFAYNLKSAIFQGTAAWWVLAEGGWPLSPGGRHTNQWSLLRQQEMAGCEDGEPLFHGRQPYSGNGTFEDWLWGGWRMERPTPIDFELCFRTLHWGGHPRTYPEWSSYFNIVDLVTQFDKGDFLHTLEQQTYACIQCLRRLPWRREAPGKGFHFGWRRDAERRDHKASRWMEDDNLHRCCDYKK